MIRNRLAQSRNGIRFRDDVDIESEVFCRVFRDRADNGDGNAFQKFFQAFVGWEKRLEIFNGGGTRECHHVDGSLCQRAEQCFRVVVNRKGFVCRDFIDNGPHLPQPDGKYRPGFGGPWQQDFFFVDVLFFKGGEVVGTIVGLVAKPKLVEKFEELI